MTAEEGGELDPAMAQLAFLVIRFSEARQAERTAVQQMFDAVAELRLATAEGTDTSDHLDRAGAAIEGASAAIELRHHLGRLVTAEASNHPDPTLKAMAASDDEALDRAQAGVEKFRHVLMELRIEQEKRRDR